MYDNRWGHAYNTEESAQGTETQFLERERW